MNLVLLSGGSGKRLWPLSNDVRSKQFIKIFEHNGQYESMVQRVYRQIHSVDKDSNITIATSKSQVSMIHNQLFDKVGICVEPCRRDTFPAFALASAYLHDVQNVSRDESVVVCPVDPYVEEDFFETLDKLGKRILESDANLALIGIEPTYPSEKYGYIIPESKDEISNVSVFKEKPTTKVAEEYIQQGALWNGGVFAFRLGYLLDRAHELIDFDDYEDLFNKYETLEKISFDYAVVEHESKIEVMRFSGQWKDLGTWNTLTEAMSSNSVGQAMFNEECENVHVVNELDVPVLCMGLKDVVVSASPEGILVSDKEQSSFIKPFVDSLDQQIRFAEKSWGSFRVLNITDDSLTIKVTLNPGHSMNYHRHEKRDEVWTVVSGIGTAILDGTEIEVSPGSVLEMPAGCCHTICAKTELEVIEVQLGKDISVQDKHKYGVCFMDHQIQQVYQNWIDHVEDKELMDEMKSMSNDQKEEAFFKNLEFGTGGLRGKIGAGPNRMNMYTVGKASQGLANYLSAYDARPSVVISYDTRIKSLEFAQLTAKVLLANNISVFMFPSVMPTPCLSFAVKKLKCNAGVMITASHNSSEYNGFKVYSASGHQITTGAAQDIYEKIEKIDIFKDIQWSGDIDQIRYIEEDLFEKYISNVKEQSLEKDFSGKDQLKIVYSPLNGTGRIPVLKALNNSGYTNIDIVKEQEYPDGNFTTCPHPNPEEAEAMLLAIELAKKENADIVLATDPDCDRVAIAIKEDKSYRLLSTNETGCLLLEYICNRLTEQNLMPEHPMFYKTIVTTGLAEKIAAEYGVQTKNVLTGFKYIGEQILELEKQGKANSFIFGFEESCGFLRGNYCLDKDGVVACLLICDMVSYYKSNNVSITKQLDSIHNKYGYYLDTQHSFTLDGVKGFQKMQKVMKHFRSNEFKFKNYEIKQKLDYKQGIDGLPSSDVLKFVLDDESTVIIRPSGTEPKLKTYYSIHSLSKKEAEMIEADLVSQITKIVN